MNKEKIFMQKDHIILPKSTLKQFSDPTTKKICYLDLSNPNVLEIKYAYPKSFHTKASFYCPELDNIIKKYETKVGEYEKKIKENIQKNDFNIESIQLKKDILKIVAIQFLRTVISDDKLLIQFSDQLEIQYNEESLAYLRQGFYPPHFLDRKKELAEAKKDINSLRYFMQKTVKYDNHKIDLQYKDFFPYILIIPEDIGSTFILSPQHFVPNDQVLRIVISPRISLALYPNSYNDCGQAIKYLTKEDIDSLVPRAIESALCMTNKFREIIGDKNYLKSIKNKLQMYSSIMHYHLENMILINGNNLKLNNCLNFHELLISLILFKPNCKNVAIKASVILKDLLYEREFIECVKLYEKYGINLVFVNDIGLENLNNYLKVVSNVEKAKMIFNFK